MRVILFTGKGGVGKSSVAAATAAGLAESGTRTLVMSTDPAHSLGDAFQAEIGGEPTEIVPNLDGLQIDAQERLERYWGEIQTYMTDLLRWLGADPLTAEEITVLPGIEEIFSLIDLKKMAESGEYDAIVVDCAPTAETLRLLSLPEVGRWIVERLFPVCRRTLKVARPVLERTTSMPVAQDGFFGAAERLNAELEDVGRILTDPVTTSVRLVVNPEKMVVAEARRLYTYLSLFGYQVDAIVANRLLPDSVQDPYFDRWRAAQKEHLESIHGSFDPVPVLTASLYDREMAGVEPLRELFAEIYEGEDALEVLYRMDPVSIERNGSDYVLQLHVPFAEGRLDLSRGGDELLVTVGPYRRSIVLPQSLQRRQVRDAKLDGPVLNVVFADA